MRYRNLVRRPSAVLSSLGKALLAIGLVCGCPSVSGEPTLLRSITELNEGFERARLVRKDAPGVLVALSAGTHAGGLGVTVHGINASAADVAPFAEQLTHAGAATWAFVYDDNYRRLGDSAFDLAQALRSQLEARPAQPLRVWAHSMGTRITLAAIEQLAREGALADRRVELELVAAPLGGFGSANLTRLAQLGPPLLLEIKNARPSLDMGSTSPFQRRLERLSLPRNVHVRVFLASRDNLVDGTHPRHRRIVKRLHAEVVQLPNTTHVSAIAAAANWLRTRARDAQPAATHASSDLNVDACVSWPVDGRTRDPGRRLADSEAVASIDRRYTPVDLTAFVIEDGQALPRGRRPSRAA